MDVYRDYRIFHDLFVNLDEIERQTLRPFNLTPLQFHALLLLDPLESWRLTDLSERLLCERSTVTRLVDFLESEGLLSRLPDKDDRRSQRLKLTATGVTLRDQARAAHEAILRQRFSYLSTEEQQQLHQLHQKLLRGMLAAKEGGEVEVVEQPAKADAQSAADDLARAPGGLLVSEVIARAQAQRYQFRHDNTIVPSNVEERQAVEVWASSGEEIPLDHATLFYTTDGSFPENEAIAIPCERMRTTWDVQLGYLTHWRALIPAQAARTVVRYRIGGWRVDSGQQADEPDVWAQNGQGFWFHSSNARTITTFAYSVEEAASFLPAWSQGAIIYQIFLDRFRTSAHNGSFPAAMGHKELHGGTLKGVRDALPYLAELAVDCLWLSPVNAAETYHRYDATDFYNVDPSLGTNEDLKELTAQAHALGIRVLLDFVPSHCSWHHPAFIEAQQDPNAPSFAWFTFHTWPDSYKCFLEHVPSLVSIDADNEQAREHIIGSAVQWVRDYGIDGFRLDHAIGQGMDFWTAFRRATRAASAESISIGEVTDTPDSLASYHGKLDYVLDFPLASALRHTFGLRDWDIQQFERFLFNYEQFMAAGPGRVSFLDNHDMNRFLFIAGNESQRLKLAALCQFTLIGPPVIYYGTEIGMSQHADASDPDAGGDAQARLDMVWDPGRWNHDLLNFYRALIQMRKATPILHEGQRRTLHVNQAQGTYAYARTKQGQSELVSGDVIVLFNLNSERQVIPLPFTAPMGYRLLLATDREARITKGGHGSEVLLASESGVALCLI